MTRRTEHLRAWAMSAAWRAISSAQAKLNLREFASRPRCGARCRSTGQPCRNPVITGRTRCRIHSGTVGRGDAWHKPVWPDGKSPKATTKLHRKLRDLDRAAKKRVKRVAMMSEPERAAYRKWQRDHEPTSIADRKRKREMRRQDREARTMHLRIAASTPRPKSEEQLELEARLAELRAELAARGAHRGGVFD